MHSPPKTLNPRFGTTPKELVQLTQWALWGWESKRGRRKEGAKRFRTGTSKKGHYHQIGGPSACGTVAICEGYATGVTIHKAMAWSITVAFDTGNLWPVAQSFRRRSPDLRIVICGDDDQDTTGNPGRSAAVTAARAVTAEIRFPHFSTVPGR